MIIRVNVVLSLTRKMTEAPETSVNINNNESNLLTTLTQTILLQLLTKKFFTECAYYMFIVHVYFKTNT